jgi:hypothetical protein
VTKDDFAKLAVKVARERLALPLIPTAAQLREVLDRHGCTAEARGDAVMLKHPDSEWEVDLQLVTTACMAERLSSPEGGAGG